LLSYILGVALASFFEVAFLFIFILFLAGLVLIIIFWSKKKIRILAFCLIFLALGILRFNFAQPKVDINKIQFYNGQEIEFVGIVLGEPDVRSDSLKLKIEVFQVEATFGDYGQVLVKTNLYPQYDYGDRLKIDCELQKPGKINDFDYEKYLAKDDIYSVCYQPKIELLEKNKGNKIFGLILKIKNMLNDSVNSNLGEPQASLLSAIILGIRRTLPSELMLRFSEAGITHIIAISGQNITIVTTILMNLGLAFYLSRKQSFYFAGFILIIYVVLTGMSASVVRAGIMGFLVLLAMRLGRLNQSTNALVFAACLMLLVNPKLLRLDISFQLSFAAILGLIYLSPVFEKWLEKIPNPFQIREMVTMTMSAQVFTLPMIIFYFSRLSVIAPLTNILILPILPYLMTLGLLAAIVGIIFAPFAQIFFWILWLMLTYIIKVSYYFTSLPLSFFNLGKMNWLIIFISYFLIILLIFRFRKNVIQVKKV
jgi:competence protein ComEC